jgi:hypothetical protein
MPLLPRRIIARIRTACSGDYGTLTWEWVLRANGTVSYRLSEVAGRSESNPWTPVTQLTRPSCGQPAVTGTRPRPC